MCIKLKIECSYSLKQASTNNNIQLYRVHLDTRVNQAHKFCDDIGSDVICKCKSNYHTIAATMKRRWPITNGQHRVHKTKKNKSKAQYNMCLTPLWEKQIPITYIGHEPYKQLEEKTNRTSFLFGKTHNMTTQKTKKWTTRTQPQNRRWTPMFANNRHSLDTFNTSCTVFTLLRTLNTDFLNWHRNSVYHCFLHPSILSLVFVVSEFSDLMIVHCTFTDIPFDICNIT